MGHRIPLLIIKCHRPRQGAGNKPEHKAPANMHRPGGVQERGVITPFILNDALRNSHIREHCNPRHGDGNQRHQTEGSREEQMPQNQVAA